MLGIFGTFGNFRLSKFGTLGNLILLGRYFWNFDAYKAGCFGILGSALTRNLMFFNSIFSLNFFFGFGSNFSSKSSANFFITRVLLPLSQTTIEQLMLNYIPPLVATMLESFLITFAGIMQTIKIISSLQHSPFLQVFSQDRRKSSNRRTKDNQIKILY